MRYGFVIPSGDTDTILELAQRAEESGWDGIFYWDGIDIEGAGPMFDPWAMLAAIALRTERMRIGAILTPVSRRRPWKLARETVTIDHLSRGRLILPVGLGALDDGGFAKVGEQTDRKVRAELLDEGLEILAGLWSGRPFAFHGKHYHLEEMTFVPSPVQVPRIPIWVVGAWPSERSMERALRYDGVMPTIRQVDGSLGAATPADVAAIQAYSVKHRASTDPWDIVIEGRTSGDDRELAAATVRPYADAGATWWIEAMWSAPNAPEDVSTRI
ncbi:MAG: LLM class flavin-dependent oxidoreductase, partial [Ktedonobacterales bacterium]